MKVINNINSNHYNSIKSIISDADQLKIVSPFLMESFDDFFKEIKDTRIKHISLTTTLNDNSPDLLKKANSLHSFCFNCKRNGIDYSVYIDNKLHGKIYISLKSGTPLKGIITSANFTNSGLENNHEWGVLIDDTSHLLKLINEVKSVESRALSSEEIEKVIKKIDSFSKGTELHKEAKIDLTVSDIIGNGESKFTSSDKRYFIKPVGVSDNPFSEHRRLATDIQKLHFSKRKPVAVREGDILICYGVGPAKLLGYFEVIEGPYYLEGSTSRWPWEVKAQNICPEYSEKWNMFNNTISTIQASYDSTVPITKNGGRTLGALNFGADKIQLTEEFANHVINIIEGSVAK